LSKNPPIVLVTGISGLALSSDTVFSSFIYSSYWLSYATSLLFVPVVSIKSSETYLDERPREPVNNLPSLG